MPRPVRRPGCPPGQGSALSAPAATGGADAPFSTRAVAGMLGVGLTCFVGFMVLLAFARGPGEQDGGAHALSRSAVGFAGIVQLLRDTGTDVKISRDPALGTGAALLVLTPGPGTRGPATLPGTAADALLLVLPKWRTSPDPDRRGWVQGRDLLPAADVLRVLPRDWQGVTVSRHEAGSSAVLRSSGWMSLRPPPATPARLQTVQARGWNPILQDGNGGMVLGALAPGGPYLLADPDILSNLGLARQADAAAAVALLTALSAGEVVAFDVSLNGFGRSRDILQLLLQPPLLGATLCAAAAALLAGLLSVKRFGPGDPAQRAIAFGKRALADNSAALISRAGRHPGMAQPYVELTRRLASRTAAVPRTLSGPELDAYLDRAAGVRPGPGAPERLSALAAEATTVRDDAGLMQLARRLHRWRMGLAHGHP